jgi:hypothetical protein
VINIDISGLKTPERKRSVLIRLRKIAETSAKTG